MPLIAVCSVKGRPGVTTTALGIAALLQPEASPVVVECDAAGGDLAARHQLRALRGLLDLATATRSGAAAASVSLPADPYVLTTRPALGGRGVRPGDVLSRHAQRIHLRDRLVELVVAPPGGIQARAAITVLAEPSNSTLFPAERVVVADCGRLDSWSPGWPLLAKADLALVLVRGRGEDLAHLGEHMAALSAAAGPRLGVLVTGDRALYGPADVAGLVDAGGDPVPVLAGLPADPHTASVLAGDVTPGRRWRRAPLMAALAQVAADPRLRNLDAVNGDELGGSTGGGGVVMHPSWLEPWAIRRGPDTGHGVDAGPEQHASNGPGGYVPTDPPAGETALVRQLRREVAQRLTEAHRRAGIAASTVAPDRQLVARLIAEALDAFTNRTLAAGSPPLRPEVESRVARAVTDGLLGMGGLQQLLDDPDVEDVVANGCDNVWVRYAGASFTPAGPVADSDDDLVDLVRMLAARSGVDERRFDRAHPILDLQLPNGSRLNAVMAVCPRPSVSIRRHGMTRISLVDLQSRGTIDTRLAEFIAAAVRARLNILIAGPTGVGKTTALRAFASAIDPLERLVTIEDSYELGLHTDPAAHPNVAALQAREANVEGEGEIGMAALFKAGLRMAPGRVLVGEARGPEVLTMLGAMSQGNDGSLGTIHASTSAGVIDKLAVYAAQAPEQLSSETIRRLIAEALHLVVQLRFTDDGLRVVTSVREIAGYDGDQVASNEIFRPGPDSGRAEPGAPLSTATLARLEAHGFDRRLLLRPGDWHYPNTAIGPAS